jgi:hypothetical protein
MWMIKIVVVNFTEHHKSAETAHHFVITEPNVRECRKVKEELRCSSM